MTAKLKPGFHIYQYSKEENEVGPKNTHFDLFDTAGLVVEGDWTAARAPIKKKEPAFPELEQVAFYADEIAWSVTLKVPPDAAPGKKALRCQASYQICNDQSCSFPGRWTLPDAVLTILPAGQANAAGAAPSAQPKSPDSSPNLVPKPIKVTAALDVPEAKPGDLVHLAVTAALEPGWHVYDFAASQPEQGPRATQFDLFESGGLLSSGDWKASTTPEFKLEPAFNDLPVAFFEGKATWILPLKVPVDAAPGVKTLRLQFGCQVCNARSCLPPALDSPRADAHGLAPNRIDDHVRDQERRSLAAAAIKRETAAPPSSPSTDAAPSKTLSEVEKTAQQGIIPLMIASALGGLLALVMPCVWPMVPITVNFFVKQGQLKDGRHRSTTGLAISYCLAIIGVFTSVGVFASFFVSATALSRAREQSLAQFRGRRVVLRCSA